MPSVECVSDESCRTKQVPDKNREANIKAYKLLRETIGDDNLIDLVANKEFSIKGEYGVYAINISCKVYLHQDIIIGPKTRPIRWKLCVDSKDHNLPEGDRILSLYLAITKDEENFIKNANFMSVATDNEYLQITSNRDEDDCQTCDSSTPRGQNEL